MAPSDVSTDPFAGLHAVLAAAPVHVDPTRQQRKGTPEVVYAAGKTPQDTLAAVWGLLQSATGRVLVTRAPDGLAAFLGERLADADAQVDVAPSGKTLRVTRSDAPVLSPTGGVVGVLTAGTSDASVADEAAWVVEEMACSVVRADDVGVAGLHRLEEPLRRLRVSGADVLIVIAGMDGALPSVVAGLVDVPVIGVPTSVGYGLGGAGVAALLSMLQTCAPGLVVVNIDNGVGAAATAGLIANRVAAARQRV